MKNLEIKIKKVHKNAVIPRYMTPWAAAMDVTAVEKEIKEYCIQYNTGWCFEIPVGYGIFVFPRSSVTNTGLIMANCVGVLDPDYRGELKVRFKKFQEREYEVGERVAQIIAMRYRKMSFKQVKELSETERGSGGFGSTGL
ncbi:MAG: dUTP diphosphatase [Candidatus Pacearchaeota archaeon]|jgi:dUTP pyrophosphatase